jgi:hypothetical protein
MDQQLLLEKIGWWVDAEGKRLEPNGKGEFPDGAIPYAIFALSNPDVRRQYNVLAPGPSLDRL